MTNYEKMEKAVSAWVYADGLTAKEEWQRWESFMNYCMSKPGDIVEFLANKYHVAEDEVHGFLYLAMTDGL